MKYIRKTPLNQFEIAHDFHEAYRRCLASDEHNHHVAIPAFANGFFACELYLYVLTDNKIQGHDLYQLFNRLSSDDKSRLRNAYKAPVPMPSSFDECLKSVSNGFEFWRYVNEEKTKEFEQNYPFQYSEYFLRTYLPIFETMAKEHKTTIDSA